MRLRMVRAGFAMVMLVAALSCTGQSAVGPGYVPPQYGPPPELTWTVSGMVRVHEAGGVHPAAPGSESGWVEGSIGIGQTTGRLPVDADGRYQFTIPAKTAYLLVRGAFHKPCVDRVEPTRETTVDLDIIRDPSQLGAHLPPELLSRLPLLSGVVFEQTASGPRPLASVGVELDGYLGMGWPFAWTMTDEQGRYTFCSVPSNVRELTLVSGPPGFRFSYADVGAGGKTTVDIELQRIP